MPSTCQRRDSIDAVLQIHPTRTCNLACRHCYSMSGPDQRESVEPALIRRLIDDAAAAGYRRVSFSGGEPLMYPALRDLLTHARSAGLSTSVTTNGTLLGARTVGWLGELVDQLAVSIDGVPESHNRVRNDPRAFQRTERGIGELERAGVPFAVIFTLTAGNLEELPWVVALAESYGARAVQVHPLESAGAAALSMADVLPASRELAQALFAGLQLDGSSCDVDGPGRTRLHADIADVRLLLRSPEIVLGAAPGSTDQLADAVRPLVLEPDGVLVPVTYGFSRRYAIGTLGRDTLADAARRWLQTRHDGFHAVCRRALDRLRTDPPELPFVNWYEHLTAVAAAADLPLVAAG